ncbi:thyrotropin subunit beta-like [Eucyclogobius newberryi]|uniref:thyrotropin subunit beta-like n=1 Tax=Eucyclogobius newberryi TaxID=166745 RepID=UPI003B5B0502
MGICFCVSSMWLLMLKCLLLCALMKESRCCAPKNVTLRMEHSDCNQCVVINTTICSGFCYTQDTNLRGRFGRKFLIQRSCFSLSMVYRTVHLPGCPPNGTHLVYPSALRCSCRRCDTRTHHCVRSRRVPRDRCMQTVKKMKRRTDPPKET